MYRGVHADGDTTWNDLYSITHTVSHYYHLVLLVTHKYHKLDINEDSEPYVPILHYILCDPHTHRMVGVPLNQPVLVDTLELSNCFLTTEQMYMQWARYMYTAILVHALG